MFLLHPKSTETSYFLKTPLVYFLYLREAAFSNVGLISFRHIYDAQTLVTLYNELAAVVKAVVVLLLVKFHAL